MIVAALNLSITPGGNGTVVLTQGDNETILSRESWERIVDAVAPRTYSTAGNHTNARPTD